MLARASGITTLARDANGPPVWFRDGKRLAFTTNREKTKPTQLQVVTIGGGHRTLWGCRGKVAAAPDGRAVICEGADEADAFNHDNLVTRAVTRLGSNDDGLGDTTPQDPAWAADGTIALIPRTEAPILLYRLRGSVESLRLSQPLGDIEYRYEVDGTPHDPDFSPDGRWLAFTTSKGYSASRPRQIWIADVKTGKIVRRLTKRGWSPSWSPTGAELAFASDRHGDVEIYVARADGSNVRRITFSRGADTEPAWRPQVR